MTPQRVSMQWLRMAGGALVISGIVLGALGAMLAVLSTRSDDETIARIVFTPVIAIVSGTIVLATSGPLERRRMSPLMWFTLLLTAITAAYWLGLIWSPPDRSQRIEQHAMRAGTLTLALLGVVIVGQLLAAEARSILVRVMVVSMAAVSGLYFSWIIALIWSPWLQGAEYVTAPLTASFAAVVLAGLLACRIALTWKRPAASFAKESMAARPRLRMRCPSCSTEQTHEPGYRCCPSCRFAMIIEIEEPRCECGYLLYRLQGNVCPECGRTV